MPAIYDQGTWGACVEHATGGNYEFLQGKENIAQFQESFFFHYWNVRVRLDGRDPAEDSGSDIRTAMKAFAKFGICPAELWPYSDDNFAREPNRNTYAFAETHKAIEYLTVRHDIDHMKACLAEGFPFAMGFSVPKSFLDEQTAEEGVLRMPKWAEGNAGGHAISVVGYDDSISLHGHHGYLWVRNSWGMKWGRSGYFLMPYSFATSERRCFDLWTLRKAS
jgi:C1A family cysteine protease